MADWSGAEYRRLSRLQDEVAAAALGELRLRGHEAVLDIGCGDGRRTADIAARVPDGRVLGIDASPLMVAAAEELRRPGLEFACMRVRDLAAHAEFDVVVSLNALHWVPRPELPDALRRIRRALRADGWALLQLVGASEERSLEQVGMDVARSLRWAQYFGDFSAPFTHPDATELVRLAQEAGFTARQTTVAQHVWPFPSEDAFVEWAAMGFGNWTDRLPDEPARAEFVREVVRTYCSLTGAGSEFHFVQLRVVLDAAG